jgi:integrase/recombinase XerD
LTAATEIIPSSSALLDRKIDEITAGLQTSYNNNLRSLSNQQNISIVVEYIQAMKTETNLSDHYRKNTIESLTRFSRFSNNKSFRDITRKDIISFLDSFRKAESVDPLHKWIGTYNQYRMLLFRFFKWLYYPDMQYRKRPNPSIIENMPYLKRREISTYKPSDLWTSKDDLLFLKYCPSIRERCYHAISRDLSCRPSEILKLKIKDIAFKTVGTSQYAEVVVNGKTGVRPLPLINSLPYLKDYLSNNHPMPSNPNAPLICGVFKGFGKHISPMRMAHIYEKFKKEVYPRLLESPNVPYEDKQQIRELLKKPWNPYVRRHSALTEKSMMLKEGTLRQHAGWTPRSQMHLKYVHYYGNESNESLLEAYGLIDKGNQINQLKPKPCPQCSEPNKCDSKFCARCRMVLTYDAYNETLENQKKKDSEVQSLKERYEIDMKSMREEMEIKFNQILAKIDVEKLSIKE